MLNNTDYFFIDYQFVLNPWKKKTLMREHKKCNTKISAEEVSNRI